MTHRTQESPQRDTLDPAHIGDILPEALAEMARREHEARMAGCACPWCTEVCK